MPKIECICKICSKEFHVWPSAIKQGKGKTCSYGCLCKYRSRNLHNGNFKKGHNPSQETIEIWKKQRLGEGNSQWKGGKDEVKDNGYIMTYAPDHPFRNHHNRIYKHRLVMEKHLGRFLNPEEVVHHKNGVRTDNRIRNLQLLPSQSHHRILHINQQKNNH